MKTLNNKSGIIVAFHTGRGGRFYNSGHVTFVGEKRIDSFVDDLFLQYENQQDVWHAIEGNANLEELYYAATDYNDESKSTAARARFKNLLDLDFGELIYTDSSGNPVGLTLQEASTGVGTINIDHDYDTTCAMYIEDCSEGQLDLIANYNGYKSSQLEDWMEKNYEKQDV